MLAGNPSDCHRAEQIKTSNYDVSAPPSQRRANEPPPLIADQLPLPSGFLLKSKSYLYNLYFKQGLSKNEIARRLNTSHSTIIDSLRRFGISENRKNSKIKRVKGQVPLGFDDSNGRLVKNEAEQKIMGCGKLTP